MEEPPRKKRRGASVVLAGMLGVVQDMLEGRERKPAEIIREADDSGAGNDDPLALDLDPEDPAQSRAVVRPWWRKP
ncbi:MAG: hypothetical protein KY439_12020 [Actinobacteria bacterium]|nr:hypothetical protein [Actinomycetota bacterium]